MTRSLVQLLLVIYLTTSLAMGSGFVYEVEQKDTLSHIVEKFFGHPIYGKRGFLLKVIAFNPNLSDPNYIFPGEKILLPLSVRGPAGEEVQALSLEEANSSHKDGFRRHSEWELEPHFYYSTISGHQPSNGSNATLLSSLNYGVRAVWSQIWSAVWKSHLFLSTAKEEWHRSSTRTLEGSRQVRSAVGAGVDYALTSDLEAGIDVSMGEETFYRATSLTNIAIDGIQVARGDFTAKYYILKLEPYELGIEGTASYLSPAQAESYTIKSGNAFRGRIILEERAPGSKIGWWGSFFYGQTHQSTTFIDLTRTDMGISVGIRIGL